MLNKMKQWKDNTVLFVKRHKGEFIAAGVTIAGVATYVILSKLGTTDEDQYMTDLIDNDEHSDECLVDGQWKPLQRDDGAYYSYAFASDEVREDFRQSGYHIVEE